MDVVSNLRVKNTFVEVEDFAEEKTEAISNSFSRQISAPAVPTASNRVFFEEKLDPFIQGYFLEKEQGRLELTAPPGPQLQPGALYQPEMNFIVNVNPVPQQLEGNHMQQLEGNHMQQLEGNHMPRAGVGQPQPNVARAPEAMWDVTTVMMRNLPNKYTRDMLMEELCVAGFVALFDFIYVPIDPETNANKGYAFINFTDSEASWRFKAAFDGHQMARFNSHKFVQVTKAALQGLDANYAHYHTARCNRGDVSSRPWFCRVPVIAKKSALGTGGRRGGRQHRRRNGARGAPDGEPAMVTVQQQQQQPQQQQQQDPVPGAARPARKEGASAFCPLCGEGVQTDYRFCNNCGADLRGVFDQ